MKLFKISTEHYSYDEFDAFIIRAEDEVEARKIAAKAAGGTSMWINGGEFLNSDHSECVEVEVNGEAGIILGSFNAS